MDNSKDIQNNQNSNQEIDWMKIIKVGGSIVAIYSGIILIAVIGGLIFMLHGFYSLNQEVQKTHTGFKQIFDHQFESSNQKTETLSGDNTTQSEKKSDFNNGDINFGLIKPPADTYQQNTQNTVTNHQTHSGNSVLNK